MVSKIKFMKKILVPIDFGEKSLGALSTAVKIAKSFDSEVVLLHIVDLNKKISETGYTDIISGSIGEDLNVDKESALAKLRLIIKEKGCGKIVTPVVIAGDVLSVLERTIEAKGIDLIVMGSDGATGLKEFFVGSNAEKVAKRVSIPVLIQKNKQGLDLRKFVFASDFSDHDYDSCFVIKNIENELEENIGVLRINTPTNFKNTPLAIKQMKKFASEVGLKTKDFVQYDYLDFEEGIDAYVKDCGVDCLIVAVHSDKNLSDRFHLSGLGSLINHIEIPILVLKV